MKRILARQKRQADSIEKAFMNNLSLIKKDLFNIVTKRIEQFKKSFTHCEYCNDVFIAKRPGKSRFCSSYCRLKAKGTK